jgi:hypothetical protein
VALRAIFAHEANGPKAWIEAWAAFGWVRATLLDACTGHAQELRKREDRCIELRAGLDLGRSSHAAAGVP